MANVYNNDNINTNYDDTGSFDANNISQDRLCAGRYMHVNKYSYILCIPRVSYSTTKMEVARAVENQLLTSGNGNLSEIENFEYVQNVTFIRAFDQVTFEALTNSRSSSSSSSSVFDGCTIDGMNQFLARITIVTCGDNMTVHLF